MASTDSNGFPGSACQAQAGGQPGWFPALTQIVSKLLACFVHFESVLCRSPTDPALLKGSMKTVRIASSQIIRGLGSCIVVAILISLATRSAPGADLQAATLQSGTVTYSNVTVYSQTDSELFIKHSSGLENIKISSLDAASLQALGLKAPEKVLTPQEKTAAVMGEVKNRFESIKSHLPTTAATARAQFPLELAPNTIPMLIALVVLIHIFFCNCYRLICINAGYEPGLLIWLPFFQIFPLLRAAKMSGWNMLWLLLPVINIFVGISWCFKIAKACGKGSFTGFMMLLPITNFFAMLYLAYSKPPGSDRPGTPPRVVLGGFANA